MRCNTLIHPSREIWRAVHSSAFIDGGLLAMIGGMEVVATHVSIGLKGQHHWHLRHEQVQTDDRAILSALVGSRQMAFQVRSGG